jgi:hypothetical protein
LRRCRAALTAVRVLLGEQPAKYSASQVAMRMYTGVQAPAFSSLNTAAPASGRQHYCQLPSLRRWHDASVTSMPPAAGMGSASSPGTAAAVCRGSMCAGTRASAWAASLAAARALASQRQFSSGAGSSGSSGGLPNAANLFPHPTLRKAVKICSACSASASHADSHPHNRPGAVADCPARYSAAYINVGHGSIDDPHRHATACPDAPDPCCHEPAYVTHWRQAQAPFWRLGCPSFSRVQTEFELFVRDRSWRHAQAWSRVGRCSGRTPTGRSCSCSAARTW